MNNNPFNKGSFKNIWLKYFNNSKKGKSFNFIKDISFVKHKVLPIFVNVGKNLTSGITYKLNDLNYKDYKGKVFVIRDLPSYHNLNYPSKGRSLKLKKLFQYEGYTTEISNYESLDQYMRSIFKTNSRYKFRKNIARLESCFDIKYTMYHGEISSEEFKHVFDTFYSLLEKRYTNKKERCGELNQELWSYYFELAYTMVNEKAASLFVIYNGNRPIGIAFNYHFGTTFIEALKVFDIDYYNYGIGHTIIYKTLEWSFNNNITLFDYTHGDFDYKKRWSNNTYRKHHYVFYDSSSWVCCLIAVVLEKKFNLKRLLRDKQIIKKYNNFRYKLSNVNTKSGLTFDDFNIEVSENACFNEDLSSEIELYDVDQFSLRKAVFDYYYKHPEPIANVKFYKSNDNENCFAAVGLKNNLKIEKINV